MISTRIYAAHPDLALSETIRSLSNVTVSVLSDAGTDPRHDAYFFLIEAAAFDAVETALADDHTVADASVVLELPGQRTYRIKYTDNATLLTPRIADRGGITLRSRSYRNGWLLRAQLPGHDALADLSADANADGIRFEILDIRQNDAIDDRNRSGLTPAQTETLCMAYGHGYYDEPRETSMTELADRLDLSATAVSGRLRRGSARLIETVLFDNERE